MERIRFRDRYRKWIIGGSVFLILLLLFLIFFVNAIIQPLLKKKLHEAIVEDSRGLYTFRIGKLDANFLGGSVEINKLEILPDSRRYAALKNEKTLPPYLVVACAEKIKISGLNFLPVAFGSKAKFSGFQLGNTRVYFYGQNTTETDTARRKDFLQTQREALRKYRLQKLAIKDFGLSYLQNLQGEKFRVSLGSVTARMKSTSDTIAKEDGWERMASHPEVIRRFGNLRKERADSAFFLNMAAIRFEKRDPVVIERFLMLPHQAEAGGKRIKGHEDESDALAFGEIRLHNLNPDSVMHRNVFQCDSLAVLRPQIQLYKDKWNEPVYMDRKIGNFPHQLLMRAPYTVRIPQLIIRDGTVVYTERSEITGAAGTVQLTHLQITMGNLTNDRQLVSKNSRATAKMNCIILGRSPLEAEFLLFLDSANGRFDLRGRIANIDAQQINPVADPLANISIADGQISELRFAIQGNDSIVSGRVDMSYQGLSLIMKKRGPQNAGEVNDWLTKIVNKYTFYPSNPLPGTPERKGRVVITRRTYAQSFFGVIWRNIFSGMQYVMMR